jgi:hypothetical protein
LGYTVDHAREILVGLFSSVKDNIKKSEAAVVIQILLEKHQKNFGLNASPAAVANKLIETTWNSAPELFNGKKTGARPHKVTIAAYALACAAHGAYEKGASEEVEMALSMCLGKILSAIESSPEKFKFTDIDGRMLALAQEIFVRISTDSRYDLG